MGDFRDAGRRDTGPAEARQEPQGDVLGRGRDLVEREGAIRPIAQDDVRERAAHVNADAEPRLAHEPPTNGRHDTRSGGFPQAARHEPPLSRTRISVIHVPSRGPWPDRRVGGVERFP